MSDVEKILTLADAAEATGKDDEWRSLKTAVTALVAERDSAQRSYDDLQASFSVLEQAAVQRDDLKTKIDRMNNRIELATARVAEIVAERDTLRAENAGLRDWADNAMFVLGMVDRNNRIDEGENPGKGWDDKFVVGEVRRVLAEKPFTAQATAPAGEPMAWRPMASAPKDGTSVLLRIKGGEHPLTDDQVHVSIGSFGVAGGASEDPTWTFAGWSWEQDVYCQGTGEPAGWLPLPDTAPANPWRPRHL